MAIWDRQSGLTLSLASSPSHMTAFDEILFAIAYKNAYQGQRFFVSLLQLATPLSSNWARCPRELCDRASDRYSPTYKQPGAPPGSLPASFSRTLPASSQFQIRRPGWNIQEVTRTRA
ncbi:hypothetical protein ColTof3_08711 [Colletotrichum tofieldiae]|nr:hypothetical protein ColTof3_08711 [Colletotrichum tofieldiae]GKT96900.1 hypothetical protein Ct61P_14750 [Colletotrichum tofieldiae]